MSGRYLYCLDCNEYLGASGGDSCHGCGWEAPHECEPTAPVEISDEMVEAACESLYGARLNNGMGDDEAAVARGLVRAALRAAMGVAK
jgi:hypothetical protein